MGLGKRIFIALIFILSSALVFAQKPVAHYHMPCKILCLGGTTGIGNNMDSVTYNGTGGTPTSYAWSWGTGGGPTIPTPNAANPGIITFTATGTYYLKVIATNGSGSSVPFTDTIFVINNCSANVVASSNTFCPGTCISFTDKSNFRPDTWSWSFDVGTANPDTSYHQNPQNICYNVVGKYTVKLTASRNTACFNQAGFQSQIITVKNCPPVIVTINTPKTTLCKGDCINFTSHITSGTAPFTYAWTFAGGTPASIASGTDSLPQTICYNTISNGNVASVTVTDANGKIGQANITINVVSCVPTAAFKAIQPICQGQCITFVDSSSAGSGGSITGYVWAFTPLGSGSIPGSTSKAPGAVCYAAAGTYTATLVVTNPSGTSTPFSRPVIVNSCPPVADFTFTPNNFCQGGCTTFTNHSTNGAGGKITKWDWEFPGGNPSSWSTDSLPPSICYATQNSYTASLTITNAGGTSQTFTQTVTVRYCPPPINVNFTTYSGQPTIPSNDVCLDSCIRITNNTTGATNYLWIAVGPADSTGKVDTVQFNGPNPPSAPGDSVTGTLPNCFVIPKDTGFLHIILFASSADSTKTLDELIHVHRCSGIFPALAPSQDNICAGDCISFMDKTTVQGGIAPPVIWQWTFYGGTPDSSQRQNPPYICYKDPGIYPVKLKVINPSNISDSITYNSLITVNEPVPVGTSFDSISVLQGTIVQLLASGGVIYQWSPATNLDFPTSNSPVFTSIDTGVYPLTVVMTDANGCSSTKTIKINVVPPDVVLAPNVFTPNNDHVNDYFNVFVSGAYASMELHVYDRWGELIFSTNTPGNSEQNVGWDGTFKGRPVNTDVYVYYYKVTFRDGTVQKKSGDITLLR